MKIEDLDPNFKPVLVGNRPIHYCNPLHAPFSLEGFPWGDPSKGEFFRLPADFKAPEDVNDGALTNAHTLTSGGCIRFRSDSPTITIRATLAHSLDMNHMPRTGSAGFDLYVDPSQQAEHIGSAQPNPGEIILERTLYTRYADTSLNGIQEWILNFPLYGGLSSIEIGLDPSAQLLPPIPHSHKPILFYGSSITQGGCASRPGNNYASLLCRAVHAEQINLGFSGCGRGEPAVARAIASLDLGAFIFDYDHNAPTEEHLAQTHEPFFRIIREAHPTLPILILSKCNIWHNRDYALHSRRRNTIRSTYQHALDAGDQNVYWIDGESLFGSTHRDACTVDGCHPNDLGFYRMFEAVLPTLQKALLKP